MFKSIPLLVSLILLGNNPASSQIKDHTALRKKLEAISSNYKATAGIAVIHIERGDTLTLHNNFQYPMQSTYKFPLAIAVLNMVDQGRITLDQKVHISKEDLMEDTWSQLKKDFPEGNVDVTIAKLLAYSVSQSDNIACDLLFKIASGPQQVNQYIHQLGVMAIEIKNTEYEMHKDNQAQYRNWCQPFAMSDLLRGLYQKKYLSESSTRLLMKLMTESTTGNKRIRGLLPKGTVVADKTGTGSVRKNQVIPACNDVGIITMPDGTHLALSVFVSNSSETIETTEKIIAMIAKEVFDYFAAK